MTRDIIKGKFSTLCVCVATLAEYMYIEAISSQEAYNREDKNVAIVIVYRRPIVWTDRLLKLACGEFTHCEIYVPKIGGTFATSVDVGMDLRFDLKQHYVLSGGDYAWHLVVMTETEYQRMCAWNMEQVAHHCRYNYSDLLWQVAPYFRSFVHDVNQQVASHPKKMFCSQAVVLALRAAFNGNDSSPHMKSFISSVNSRLTTPGGLMNALNSYMGVCASNELVPMTVDVVNKCTDAAVDRHKRMNVY
jgi:hypothetical protein